MIGCGNQRLFEVLCNVLLKKPKLITDERFLDVPLRVKNNKAFKAIVEEWLQEYTVDDAVSMILAQGIPSAPIWDLKQISESEHARARGMFKTVSHPSAGEMKLNASPIKLSGTPAEIRSPSPVLGEHNSRILRTLDYDDDAIAALHAEGVI